MKQILFIAVALFLLSSCSDNIIDRTVQLYEDAADKTELVEDIKELHSMERQFNKEILKWKRENANEFAELRKKADAGDENVKKQFEQLEESKRAYRDAKRTKRDDLREKRRK
ncbi:MAG: lipoprotein [Bacteroidaceae bacterium]|nr:lipoprotein [Bacteroidaceae bacterium]